MADAWKGIRDWIGRHARLFGLILTASTVILYVLSTLCSVAWEPLLVLIVLVFLPVGIYLTAERGPGLLSAACLEKVRLN